MGVINGFGIVGLCVYVIGAVSSTTINSDGIHTSTNECSTIVCSIERHRSLLSILSFMNENVQPCDNFYDYVCGNYAEAVDMDNKKPYTFIEKSNEDIVREMLYESIKHIYLSDEKSHARKLVKKFFNMCMDEKTRKVQTPETLREIINKLHGSPMIENSTWNEESWRWEDVYHEAMKLGVPTDIFLLDIDARKLNDPLSESLRLYNPKKARIDDSHFIINYKFQDEYPLNKDRSEQQFNELVSWETSISGQNFSELPIETRVSFVRRNFFNIDWDKLLDLSVYGIEFNERSELITLESIEYLNWLNNNAVPKRVLANYQIWKFLEYAYPYLHWDLTGSSDSYWKTCVDTVRKSLPHITDAIFIQEHFDKDIKDNVLEMIANIKEQYKKSFNSISWLDQSARDFAIEKLEATQYFVAYPDEMLDYQILDEFYKDHEVVEGDFLNTALRFNFLSRKRRMQHYKTFNHTSFEALSSWLESKTFNYVAQNTIRIPAGFLQDKNYNKYRTMYTNYGTLGRQIAQEIAHSFDRHGIYLNKDGNLESLHKHGINDIVFRKYNNRTSCLIDQYNRYKYPRHEEPVDGYDTNPQNMADVNGIRVAYHAYQQWVKNHGPEPNFAHTNLTTNQLYWMSFAHVHCDDVRSEEYYHSPDYWNPSKDVRVIGSVSNSPEFAADFNCPSDSRMNPTNKCVYT